MSIINRKNNILRCQMYMYATKSSLHNTGWKQIYIYIYTCYYPLLRKADLVI